MEGKFIALLVSLNKKNVGRERDLQEVYTHSVVVVVVDVVVVVVVVVLGLHSDNNQGTKRTSRVFHLDIEWTLFFFSEGVPFLFLFQEMSSGDVSPGIIHNLSGRRAKKREEEGVR